MKTLRVSVGASIAFLLAVAFASPALACDGEKEKDKKTEGESAVQVDRDLGPLACDGDKDDDKEGDSATTDVENLLACDGDKDDDKEGDSFAA